MNDYWKDYWREKYKNKSTQRTLKTMAKLEKYKYYAFPDYQNFSAPYGPYNPAVPPFMAQGVGGGIPPYAAAHSPFNAALAASYATHNGYMPDTVIQAG